MFSSSTRTYTLDDSLAHRFFLEIFSKGVLKESCSTSERKVCQTACGPWRPCAGALEAEVDLLTWWGEL